MTSPILHSYKRIFCLQRFFQTFLGGVHLLLFNNDTKWYFKIYLVIVQILIFEIPVIIFGIITNHVITDNIDSQHSSNFCLFLTTYSLSLFFVDLLIYVFVRFCLSGGISCKLRNKTTASVSSIEAAHNELERNSAKQMSFRPNVLSEGDDQIVYSGYLSLTTWKFLTPNFFRIDSIMCHLLLLLVCNASCTFAAMMCIHNNTLTCLKIFILCSACLARYSGYINTTIEMAIFDTTGNQNNWHLFIQSLYRPFYLFLLTFIYFIFFIINFHPLYNKSLNIEMKSQRLEQMNQFWSELAGQNYSYYDTTTISTEVTSINSIYSTADVNATSNLYENSTMTNTIDLEMTTINSTDISRYNFSTEMPPTSSDHEIISPSRNFSCCAKSLQLLTSLLPLLWTFGMLSPVDAFCVWSLEMISRVITSCSPSYICYSTIINILFGMGFISLLTFLSQVPVSNLCLIILQLTFGFFMCIDIGNIVLGWIFIKKLEKDPTVQITSREKLKNFLQTIEPLIIIMISILLILGFMLLKSCENYDTTEYILIVLSLGLSMLTKHISAILLVAKISYLPSCYKVLFKFANLLLRLILQFWFVLELSHISSTSSNKDVKSQMSICKLILLHCFIIRIFTCTILHPKITTFNMLLAWLFHFNFDKLFTSLFDNQKFDYTTSFVMGVIFVTFCRDCIARLWKYFIMMRLITYSTFKSTLISETSHKIYIGVASIVLLPITIVSTSLAAFIKGSTLVPIFTLPIFGFGFPRPIGFWKRQTRKKLIQIDKKSNMTQQEIEGSCINDQLDLIIYSQIANEIVPKFVERMKFIGLNLEEGTCYLARYENRLLFLRIVSAEWNHVCINVKGLESQEQTSCHHQEAAAIDILFEDAVNPIATCVIDKIAYHIKNPFYNNITHWFTLPMSTAYTKSKSIIPNLTTEEEFNLLNKMFYYAFSFLWIKYNPIILNTNHENHNNKSPHSNRTDIFKTTNGKRIDNNGLLNLPSILTKPAWLDESIKESSPSTSNLDNQPTTTNVLTIQKEQLMSLEGGTKTFSSINWIKLCLGNAIPAYNAIRSRVDKLSEKLWSIVYDSLRANGMVEGIDFYEFFEEDFLSKNDTKFEEFLSTLDPETVKIQNFEELCIKSFRFSAMLTLDEIYNGTSDSQETIEQLEVLKRQLNEYETNYLFCTFQQLPRAVNRKYKNIITMTKIDDSSFTRHGNHNHHETRLFSPTFKSTQMRRMKYGPDSTTYGNGIIEIETPAEFHIGRLSEYIVQGIWSSTNIELLYLTSDDDERFSIQQDRHLLRNIMIQCADQPLGYPVYDETFCI